MSKQLLSFVCLSVLTLAYPNYRALANATEDSDRQFLEQLESGTAPQSNPAPTPRANPAPSHIAPTASTATQPQTTTAESPKVAPIAKRSSDSTKLTKKAQERIQQLPEVADGDLQTAPVPVNVTTVVVDSDSDHDRDHDRHRHFFRRLFRGLFKNNNGHPEDW
jgi:hypothetical protein